MKQKLCLKKCITIALISTVSIAITLSMFTNFASASPEKEKISLSYADYSSKDHNRAMQVRKFFDMVNKEAEEQGLGIELDVTYHWGGGLVGTGEQLDAIGHGLADTGVLNTTYWPSQTPLHGAGRLPFGIAEVGPATLAWLQLYEEFPELKEELTRNNLQLLFLAPLPSTQIALNTDEPVKRMEDLEGLRIRSTGSLDKPISILGATPVSVPFPEVYSALEKGAVDGTVDYVTSVVPFQHQEVMNYWLQCYLGAKAGDVLVLINKDKWDSFPSELQEIMKDKREELVYYTVDLYNRLTDEAHTKMKEEGVEIYSLDSKERKRWEEKVRPVVWDSWKEEMDEKGLPGSELADRFFELGEKYEEKFE